jgi:hypothetical protein
VLAAVFGSNNYSTVLTEPRQLDKKKENKEIRDPSVRVKKNEGRVTAPSIICSQLMHTSIIAD